MALVISSPAKVNSQVSINRFEIGRPAGNIAAKRHSEHFNAEVNDEKDHPFDTSGFDRYGKNYQGGFLKGSKDAGNGEDKCQSAEDNQD